MYMEYPRYTCKEIIDKGKTITYVGCCGVLKWCDKIKNKENKKSEDKNDGKIAIEIEKVKKSQRKQKKEEGE